MTIIFFILIFGLVVISHEFGHFLLAKMNGIHVVEFAVGMGPTLWFVEKGGTKYSLKLFPIGGACMFEGEDGVQDQDKEPGSGSFLKANVWSRISSVLAGPIFNFLLAFIIAVIMVYMMAIAEPVVSAVVDSGAAQEAGMQEGDRILSLDGERIYLYEEIVLFNLTSTGKPVLVKYERDGQKYETTLIPQYDESTGRQLLGISCSEYVQDMGIGRLKYAWYQMRYSVKQTVKSLGMLVQGRVGRKDVAGPVGMANIVGQTYEKTKQYGWETVLLNMLNITLLLSVNLGIINLLPLPALDGGRLVFLILEIIRGKPVPPEKEGMVHFIGLVFFMLLMVVILFNDISNLIHP